MACDSLTAGFKIVSEGYISATISKADSIKSEWEITGSLSLMNTGITWLLLISSRELSIVARRLQNLGRWAPSVGRRKFSLALQQPQRLVLVSSPSPALRRTAHHRRYDVCPLPNRADCECADRRSASPAPASSCFRPTARGRFQGTM